MERTSCVGCVCLLLNLGVGASFFGWSIHKWSQRKPWMRAEPSPSGLFIDQDVARAGETSFKMEWLTSQWSFDMKHPKVSGDWEVQHRCTGLWTGEADWVDADSGTWVAGTDSSFTGRTTKFYIGSQHRATMEIDSSFQFNAVFNDLSGAINHPNGTQIATFGGSRKLGWATLVSRSDTEVNIWSRGATVATLYRTGAGWDWNIKSDVSGMKAAGLPPVIPILLVGKFTFSRVVRDDGDEMDTCNSFVKNSLMAGACLLGAVLLVLCIFCYVFLRKGRNVTEASQA